MLYDLQRLQEAASGKQMPQMMYRRVAFLALSIKQPVVCKRVANRDHILAVEVAVLAEQDEMNSNSEGMKGLQVWVCATVAVKQHDNLR